MVLYSQSPRSATSHRYNATSSHHIKRWLWIGAAVAGLALAGLYLWFSDQTQARAVADSGAGRQGKPAVQPRPLAQPTKTAASAAVQASAPTPTTATQQEAPTAAAPEAQPGRPAHVRGATHSGTSDAQFIRGMNLIADRNFVQGRRLLSELLDDQPRRLNPADAQAIRDTLTSVNRTLVFGPQIVAGDPLSEPYLVLPGQTLSAIAPKYQTTFQYLERVNGINGRNLRAGQTIKVPKGPFRARVTKHDYRLDLFANDTDGTPLYICSFPVGLGQDDSTPEGAWVVGPRKAQNPDWRNPRTNRYYRPDDPTNPIGEYWIPLLGTDEKTKSKTGYGIHGTIEPQSVGTQASMGCIRLRADDIELLFHMLVSEKSSVEILP